MDLSTRSTHIYVSSAASALYPSEELLPSSNLFPVDAGEEVTTIVAGTMSLDEMIADGELVFGQLFATKFEVTLYDVPDLSGKYITVYQDNGASIQRIFSGVVDSSKRNKDGLDRHIVAYDAAYMVSNKNVADWWESFWSGKQSATILSLRTSLLNYCGIRYEEVSLPNDGVSVTKDVSHSVLPFSSALKALCEVNCCFPHFSRDGVLEFIVLDDESEPIDISGAYEGINSTFEDYTTDTITGVKFLDSSGATKRIVGQQDNMYVVSQDNFLLYGLGTSELDTIGANMMSYIGAITYVPCSVSMIVGSLDYGLGSRVDTGVAEFYIMQNSYSNTQLVDQTMRAVGNKRIDSDRRALETSSYILNEKYSRLNFTVEEFMTEFGEYKQETDGTLSSHNTRITQNATAITSEANRATSAEGTLSSRITQNANSITSEVTRATNAEGSLSTRITQNANSITSEVTRATNAENSIVTQTAEAITQAVTGVAHNYTGTVVPTTSNSPASGWTTTAEKQKHINDVYFNSATGKSYRWTQNPSDGIRLKFSSQSRTESTNYDYVYIYYKKGSTYYKYGKTLGDTSIANAEVFVPASTVYLYWKSDRSNTYWGFKVTDVSYVANGSPAYSYSSSSLPRTVDEVVDMYHLPETSHPYSDNEAHMWQINTDYTVSNGNSWGWVQIESSTIGSKISQTADNISLKVSADGVISAINLSPESIKIDASKVDITGFVTFSDLSTAGQTTVNGSNITTGTISADNGNMTINLSTGKISATKFSLATSTLKMDSSSGVIQASQSSGSRRNRMELSAGKLSAQYSTNSGSSWSESAYIQSAKNGSYNGLTVMSSDGNILLKTNAFSSYYPSNLVMDGEETIMLDTSDLEIGSTNTAIYSNYLDIGVNYLRVHSSKSDVDTYKRGVTGTMSPGQYADFVNGICVSIYEIM